MLVGKVFSIMHIVLIAKILMLSMDVRSISLQEIHLQKMKNIKKETHILYPIQKISFNTNLTNEDKLYINFRTPIVPTLDIAIRRMNYKENI